MDNLSLKINKDLINIIKYLYLTISQYQFNRNYNLVKYNFKKLLFIYSEDNEKLYETPKNLLKVDKEIVWDYCIICDEETYVLKFIME